MDDEHLDASHEAEAFLAEALDASQLAEQAAFSPVEVSAAFVVAHCSVADFLEAFAIFLDEQELPSQA
ncbi:MAG: hypothetical protein KDB65_05670 [Calditrichaeota bacterium]|nr:hypothetical protein [Calditrichota bacterium]MCB9368137.1 hypothetical protein [Calditrichota bacterium]